MDGFQYESSTSPYINLNTGVDSMSKTQDKKELRIKEAKEFVAARRSLQVELFEQNIAVGMKIYEENKDKFTPEEIEILEKEIQRNKELLEKFKNEANTDA
jgi:cob(I)alamin adenosyltransferase